MGGQDAITQTGQQLRAPITWSAFWCANRKVKVHKSDKDTHPFRIEQALPDVWYGFRKMFSTLLI